MAYEESLTCISLNASAAITAANQYRFVVLNGSRTFALASLAGADAFGVVQDTPAAGEASAVATDGVTKVVAGAAITAGAAVTTDNAGRAVAATTGNRILGNALTGASAAGQIISVRLDKNGIA